MKKILIFLLAVTGLTLNATSHLDAQLDDLKETSTKAMQKNVVGLKNLAKKHKSEWDDYFVEWKDANLDTDEDKELFIDTMTQKAKQLESRQKNELEIFCKGFQES